MLRTSLNEALKIALKSQDKCEISTLRLILAALKDRDIAARSTGNCDGIAEDEILEMLNKMVRQRLDSAEIYRTNSRPELADKEERETLVIRRFLPQPLDDDELQGAVGEVIGELEAQTIKDMGKVMGTLKERFAGRMDFGKASALVKQQLA